MFTRLMLRNFFRGRRVIATVSRGDSVPVRFQAMKLLITCFIVLLAVHLTGCTSTRAPNPTDVPAWRQIQLGMTRQQVYAALGAPLRETGPEAEWKSAEAKIGWPSSTTTWRVLRIEFDPSDHVKATREQQQQK